MRICFVCLGNICRSPAAEAIVRHRAGAQGLAVQVESAGTGPWHVGDPPHEGTRSEAARRGIPVDHLGQQFGAADFARFDLVVAMDSGNAADLRDLAPDADARDKIVRLGEFAPEAASTGVRDVPDPYGQSQEAFTRMFDQLEPACDGLVQALATGAVGDLPGGGRR
ncbi:MAG: low molecular weight protein-tyrosine-phosphatase [Ornithinimicrobium sp.]|jgi:protein-tyrosine phosphatase|uniref:low molecular weight protein-tyrosine-phosphatase n=1 Tax=Ornithinimicrobium sp. TaxID=1977084 RepID=UPI00181C0027|nr:low molecular weight phosphotyrosine protein phosphatase [Actinomycetota bacterium]